MEIMYDALTKDWFKKNPGAQTTCIKCEQCGLYYKPSLGHVCNKAKEERAKTGELRRIYMQITESPVLYKYTVLIMGRSGPTGKTCVKFTAEEVILNENNE